MLYVINYLKDKQNSWRLVKVTVYLPGLCNAFLEQALKLLELFQ
jgi:hypothetical protein